MRGLSACVEYLLGYTLAIPHPVEERRDQLDFDVVRKVQSHRWRIDDGTLQRIPIAVVHSIEDDLNRRLWGRTATSHRSPSDEIFKDDDDIDIKRLARQRLYSCLSLQ